MKLTEFQEKNIEDWARANKSDPFAERVARTHYSSGICSDGKDYEVTEDKEERKTSKGGTFSVQIFKRMKRP